MVRSYFGRNPILPLIFRLLNQGTARTYRDNWLRHAAHLKPVAIDNGIFLSAGRPKLIVDMVRALLGRKSSVTFVPLLRDFMPLHDGATKRFRKVDRNFLADNRFLIEHASPDDAPHLASTIHHLMTDHEFQIDLRNRIQNSKKTLRTWNMVAHETLQALKTSQSTAPC